MVTLNDAQINHLKGLEAEGRLTPSAVLEDARQESSPLHTLYTWDINEAAERYWIEQTRAIIREVYVEVRTTIVVFDAPRYVSDPALPGNQEGYVSVGELSKNPELSRLAVLKEISRAMSMLKRAQKVSASLGISTTLTDVLTQVEDLRAALSAAGGEQIAA